MVWLRIRRYGGCKIAEIATFGNGGWMTTKEGWRCLLDSATMVIVIIIVIFVVLIVVFVIVAGPWNAIERLRELVRINTESVSNSSSCRLE
jgi:Na+/H+-dicarboxylate symporter